MSGLLYNRGGFNAQGTEINGKGVSQEQTTAGTIVTSNGTSATPAAIAVLVEKFIRGGGSGHGLER